MADAGRGNRWKKIAYQYDLISGKVNTVVSYQPGQPDAFYHRYSYDADNRITNVETSNDSIYWENDAFYQYYKYGPLARSVIGQQQVQGLDYAYTLQGWLKGVNSTAVTSAFDMGHDGTTGSIVAKDAFGFSLHYYGNNEYSSVNNTITPFAAVSGLTSLFNGNISAISQNLPSLGNPLLYSYNYDVLNRLKKMQASNGLNTATNTWTPVVLPDYKESISYDANGNILTYDRYGNKAVPNKQMDSLTYSYQTGTNKLDFIKDDIAAANYDNDIDNQSIGNYNYDAIGNLVKDSAGSIRNISWNVYGKIATITKTDGTTINYTYDVAGNRVSKTVNGIQTWYVRDASGNVMSVYTKGDNTINSGAFSQTETHLYGSSRLGINTLNTNMESGVVTPAVNLTGLGSGFNINFIRGKKFFELSNHLGNVLATVSDKKTGIFAASVFDHYEANIVSSQEYYPFGMQMPGREFSSSEYRYGFNGQEKSDEIDGNHNTALFWEYDSRIGRRWNVDPVMKYFESPYAVLGNNPIYRVDPLGNTDTTANGGQGLPSIQLKEVVVTAKKPEFTREVLTRMRHDAKIALADELFMPKMQESKIEDIKNFARKGEAQSLGDMLLLSRYQRKSITLGSRMIGLIEEDNNFRKFEAQAVTAIRNGATSYNSVNSVLLGGDRGSLLGLIIPLPSSMQTIRASVNELTWSIRNVYISATLVNNGSGRLEINYYFMDQFDLKPGGREAAYNITTSILGGMYHGILGNSGPDVIANWTKTY